MPVRAVIAAVLLVALVHFAHGAEPSSTFDATVAPVLARRCLGCHNGSDQKGGLDLAQADAATQGGDSGPAFVPGDLDASLLWQRVSADEMPPEHPLPEAERAALREWITTGAAWGTAEIDPFRYSSESRAGYDWWSLQPVTRPTPPEQPVPSEDAYHAWPRNDLDRFVLAALAERGLCPAAEADRRTLIRRVTFDLTGLPPTPGEVAAFESDAAPDAYERLVDRLLASPQYGVRWARHWLDVVRFGESNGFEFDEFRRNAWPYRDWVVDAFNRDLPYDEFARLQIAGDALHPSDLDANIATGFLVAGAYDTVGQGQISDAMRAVVRQDELEDLVGVVGQTFLGLTVNCARCHDHKFDPIRQREYFQLVSSLSGVRHGERELAELLPAGERGTQVQALRNRLEALAAQRNVLEAPVRERLLAERGEQAVDLRPWKNWDFRNAASVAGIELHGSASFTADGLQLDGETAYASTPKLDREIAAKTLEVCVRLANTSQQGGAAISIQTPDGGQFDAIVFGEREEGQWMAGSEGYVRTQSFQGAAEDAATTRVVKLCMTYAEDGTITCYRDGQLYGKPYQASPPLRFAAGNSEIVFGLRHAPANASRLLSGVIEQAAVYDRELAADEIAASAGASVTQQALRAAFSEEQRSAHDALQREENEIRGQLTRLHPARGYVVSPKEPDSATHLLARGDPSLPREVVSPQGISSVRTSRDNWQLAADAPEAQRRAALARWMTAAENPLFARVIVNRVWHYHFGVGIVDTPNDFGFNGGRASNQPLLDWLAAEFAASGYRLKALHRLIVTSSTYRQAWRHDAQAQQIDTDNRLLWRGPMRRLEAEAARDAMLSVAGELDLSLGGPGYQDMIISVAPGTAANLYAPDEEHLDTFRRRTLYRVWARSGRSAMLDVLDCPDPSATSPRRAVTTTPLQALSLLNNTFALHIADCFAARLQREAGVVPEAQATLAYQLAYGRAPSEAELNAAAALIRTHGAAALARAIFNSNEFLYVD